MKNSKLVTFLEGFIMVMIGLVLVQTFLEDFSVVIDASSRLRTILIFTAFGFDLLFTVEFLVRFFSALTSKKTGEYFIANRGWVDLLSSVPLLLLNSGPGLYALLTSTVFAGAFSLVSLLKIVKAIRIARMLRLLRFLKVFRQIKFANSVMVQRHMTRIITTTVSFFILLLLAANMAFSLWSSGDIEDRIGSLTSKTASWIASEPEALQDKGNFIAFCSDQELLLMAKKGGKTLYSRHGSEHYAKYYTTSDYHHMAIGDWEFFFDGKPIQKRHSRENLISFVIIVGIILGLMLFYSPHFALTVSDPVNIMNRGMGEKSYNLEVKIPRKWEQDEVFALARRYNEEFLPMKARSHTEGHEGNALDISMEDIKDLFE